MDIYTIDTETFYDTDYSLSKLTTEEYVRDARFDLIGMSIKKNDKPARWISAPLKDVRAALRGIDWSQAAIVAHNCMFDGAVLAWRLGVRPKVWFDTLSMSRAVHGPDAPHSLAALAKRYGLPDKGDEVVRARGLRREDFHPVSLARYGDYCRHDTELCYEIFLRLLNGFPKAELQLIDLTLRMFTEPVLQLDKARLEAHLADTVAAKAALLDRVGVDKKDLMSNDRFAALLQSYGVDPPTKISPRTGKQAWAFAKTDPGMRELAEHEDFAVQALVAARLGNKSTLEETRTQRFIEIADRGLLPIPLRYYAAHTGRWGGSDKINLQNLPSRGASAGKIKKAIVPIAGHVVIDSDSSQIEARMLAWLAGQTDMVETFRNNDAEIRAGVPKAEMQFDPYKRMASAIYGVAVDQISSDQRHVGKTTVLGCFAADTKVLTQRGWVPIAKITSMDKLWDGVEWVSHQGVIPQGVKETIRVSGVAATADHAILTGHGWQEWQEVHTHPSLFRSALALASSKLPDGFAVSAAGGTLKFGALAVGPARSPERTCGLVGQHDATHARSARAAASDGASTAMYYPMTRTGSAFSTAYPRACPAATPPRAAPTRTMVPGVSMYGPSGERTVQRSYGISSLLKGGTTRAGTSTVSTTAKATSPATFGLPQRNRTHGTGERWETCKLSLMTYDIAFAGPRNRYTIATDAGPLIVHNCGYGMGPERFQAALMNGFPRMELPSPECERIIKIYRRTNRRIQLLWKAAGQTLAALHRGEALGFDVHDLIEPVPEVPGLRLPSGLLLQYPGLTARKAGTRYEYSYASRQGPVRIYGAKTIENVVQALARIVVASQMLRIARRYRPALTVHDSVVAVVAKDEADEARAYIETCMRWVPSWAEGLPVNCEIKVSPTYGG